MSKLINVRREELRREENARVRRPTQPQAFARLEQSDGRVGLRRHDGDRPSTCLCLHEIDIAAAQVGSLDEGAGHGVDARRRRLGRQPEPFRPQRKDRTFAAIDGFDGDPAGKRQARTIVPRSRAWTSKKFMLPTKSATSRESGRS